MPVKERNSGSAYWTYDYEAEAWYFGLNERAAPPYRKQVEVKAIVDLDENGQMAGVEIYDWSPNGKPFEPPIPRKV